MKEENPYALLIFYISGVIVVALVVLFELLKEYREEKYISMTFGRAARLFFAIAFSWLSCIAPLCCAFCGALITLTEADFWNRKIKTKKYFR